MKLSLIVAMTKDGLIGANGGLPWGRIPEDMRHFKTLTMGQPVIMGRKTWESLGGRHGLLGRMNLVLSKSLKQSENPSVFVRRALFPAIRTAIQYGYQRAWAIGGASVFGEASDSFWFDSAHVTLIDGQFTGDTYFPFPILDSPEWVASAPPTILAPGVVCHHLERVRQP